MPRLHPRFLGRSLCINVIPRGLAMHPIPFLFLWLIALVSGIASQMTSDVSSQYHLHRHQHHRIPASNSPSSSLSLHLNPHNHLQEHQQHLRSHGLVPIRPYYYQTSTPSPSVNLLESSSKEAEGRRPPPVIHSDSILEMIDREQVGRILARKKEEEEQKREKERGMVKVKGEGEGEFSWIKGIAARGRMTKGDDEEESGGGDDEEEEDDEEEGGEEEEERRNNGGRELIFRRPRKKKPSERKTLEGGKKERKARRRVSLSRLSKKINDSSLMTLPLPNPPAPSSPIPFPPLRRESDDKILKSSKDALVVTRREYLRRDWCRTEPLVQRIKLDGCLSKTLVNGFCYGQCNSFYIPRSPVESPSRKSGASEIPTSPSSFPMLYTPAFTSCAFCKPKEIAWTIVTLRCPSLKPAQFVLKRRVERIKQCKCITEIFN